MAYLPFWFRFGAVYLIIAQLTNAQSLDQKQLIDLTRKAKVEKLGQYVNNILLPNPEMFYNYSVVCGRDADPNSRVGEGAVDIDLSIPIRFRQSIKETYVKNSNRLNKCPVWSKRMGTEPETGSMDLLTIKEDTKVNKTVYILSATDSDPIYYFIRNVENDNSDMIFRVNTNNDGGFGYNGEVILNQKLDAEVKTTYNFLVYAFDGLNLIERYSTVKIQNVDDEVPKIVTTENRYYDRKNKLFKYEIDENASIGHFLNERESHMQFEDIDTPLNLLEVKLVDAVSGVSTVPFTMTSTGNLELTSSLDYEKRDEYLLKVIVKDTSGASSEEKILIKVRDVADHVPIFEEPVANQEFTLPENSVGLITRIAAVSNNSNPAGPIAYKISKVNPIEMNSKFSLSQVNESWYLNCTKENTLKVLGQHEIVEFEIIAIESSPESSIELMSSLKLRVKIIGGDVCAPSFSKDVYTFTVKENEKLVLADIFVHDCDHAENGKIFLSTQDPNFEFKVASVYREGNVALEMKKSFDYEVQTRVQFTIFAHSSGLSLNNKNSSALVIIEIEGKNEFAPEFVLPKKQLSNTQDFFVSERFYKFLAEENKDFKLSIKAEDLDHGLDGNITYSIEKINQDETFEVETTTNQVSGTYDITIDGAYLDADSSVPITFIVNAKNQLSETKQSNEIIINVVASASYARPAYFEKSRYNFEIQEKALKKVFKLKLINDNLNNKAVEIIKVQDELDLFDFEIQSSSLSRNEASNFGNEQLEKENNEELVLLTLKNIDRLDIDQLYISNNNSDVYTIILKAQIKEQPSLSTTTRIVFKLIDENDNTPVLLRQAGDKWVELKEGDILHALVPRSMTPNTPIQFQEIVMFSDKDFSKEFGVESVHFKLNDTRFQVDNRLISETLMKLSESKQSLTNTVPFILRKLTKNEEEDSDKLWIEVKGQDNYFCQSCDDEVHNNQTFIIEVMFFDDEQEVKEESRIIRPPQMTLKQKEEDNLEESLLWKEIESIQNQVNHVKLNGTQSSNRTHSALVKLVTDVIKSNLTESISISLSSLKIFDAYQFSVDEEFTGEVGQVVGVNAQKRLASSYELLDHLDLLSIDSKTGVISTTKGLDYEDPSQRLIECTVRAVFEHDGQVTTEQKLKVQIVTKPVNEPPVFSSDSYMFTVILDEEIDASSEIGMVYVKDLDELDHTAVDFVEKTEVFGLEKIGQDEANFTMYKLFNVKSFERNATYPLFELQVESTDSLGKRNRAHVTVKVVKVDKDVKLPALNWITRNSLPSEDSTKEIIDYEAQVANSFAPGQLVLRMEAKPAFEVDSPIRYKLITHSELFEINETTGEISTRSSFSEAVKLRSPRSTIFVQAYYNSTDSRDNSTIPVWSKVAVVNIGLKLVHLPPVFTHPANNSTRIVLRSLKNKDKPVYAFQCGESVDVAFQYGAGEILSEQEPTKVDQFLNSRISLRFSMNARTGELSFKWNGFTEQELLTIFQNTSSSLLAKLTIVAQSQDLQSEAVLFVLFHQDYLFEIYRSLYGDLSLKFEANFPVSKELTSDTFNHLTNSEFASKIMDQLNSNGIKQVYLSIKLSTEANSAIVLPKTFIKEQSVQILPYSFIVSSVPASVDNKKLDPTRFFFYDNEKKQVVLTRQLDTELVNKTIRFRLKDTRDLANELTVLHKAYDINVFIADNDFAAKPAITVRDQENLDTVYMLDLSVELAEQNKDLAEFTNKEDVLNEWSIENGVNCTVGFNPTGTDSLVLDSYEVDLDGQQKHIAFKRRLDKNGEMVKLDVPLIERAYESLGRRFFQFTIKLENKVHSVEYTAKLYIVEFMQLKRVVQSKTSRFQGELQRSKVPNTVISLKPPILLTNPLPFNINIRLVDTNVPVIEYFDMKPKVVQPTGNNLPRESVIYLVKSLEESERTKLWSDISFGFELHTDNLYINKILQMLREPCVVDLTMKLDNQFAPEITQVKLMNETMTGEKTNYAFSLKEGKYNNLEIGSIVALDKDEGERGRVEYFLIGSSQLSINKTTGVVSLNGAIDAENENVIVFYCYARDMAESSDYKQSETVRFTLEVIDENESTPMILSSMHFKTLRENDQSTQLPAILGHVSCSDNDISAHVTLLMEAIRYVVDGERVSKINESYDKYLKSLFKMVVTEDSQSSQRSQKADLLLIETIDYELLYRPNETLIEIEFTCSDGTLASQESILLKVDDINDNTPIFLDTLPSVIEVNETTDLLKPLIKLSATDLDLSKEFGAESLVYSISNCTPDVYGFYVKLGMLHSKFDLDADTDRMIEARRKDFSQHSNVDKPIEISCKLVVSDSFGGPNSLSSEKNLTIRFNNLNDNAPVILRNNLKIEVQEGQKSQGIILAQIEIFDRDDASNLKCLFENDRSTFEYFELKTETDVTDPFKAWCILKVQDDMYINYDSNKRSNYLLNFDVLDQFKEPVGNNRGKSQGQINVHVLSVNNRPPMFLNGNEEAFYSLDSAKTGTLIGTILATDTENLNPEQLIYILNTTNSSVLGESDKFELFVNKKSDFHWGTVELITKSKLDAKESPYTLVVTAYDGPINFGTTKSSQKHIKVYVINKGSFNVWVDKKTGEAVDYYTQKIDEELPADTLVITVQAVLQSINQEDLEDTEIVYEVEPYVAATNSTITINNPFYRINATTGEIFTTATRLDYEEVDPFKKQLMRDVKVKATSTDGLHKYSTRVSFEIIDQNDNVPIISLFTGFCVVENSISQLPVGAVKAEDLDSGLNGEIQYKLNETALNYQDASEFFEINSKTGQIFLKKKIDRETNSSILLSVIASDKGLPEARYTSVDINICVNDVNDNMPIFDPELPRILDISENNLVVDMFIKAIDLDFGSNGTVFYYIQEDQSNKFIIDPVTQKLNLTSPLDYESLQTFNLTIISSDYGSPKPNQNKLSLKINVLDKNDNEPRFSSDVEKFFDLKVNYFNEEDPQLLVGNFAAVDKDLSTEYSQVGYRINSVLSRRIKHNALPTMDETKFMDPYNEPLFTFENGTLTASVVILNQTSQNYFFVDLEAYDIENEMLNDRLNVSIIFRLPIKTSEHPVLKQMSLTRPKQITVAKNTLPTEQKLDVKNAHVIHIVQAEDPTSQGLDYFLDSVEESQMRNSRNLGNGSQEEPMNRNSEELFKVDRLDGVVTAIKPRTSYTAKFYRMRLRVVLRVDPTIEVQGYLVVNIDSKMESLFSNQVFTVTVRENLLTETNIFDLSEKLIFPNNQTLFELNEENSLPTNIYNKWFSLVEDTGVVSTRSGELENVIDYEAYKEVLLGINVLDRLTFDLIETVILKIQIQDLNDNAPMFDVKYNYNPVINEDDKQSVLEDRLITKFRASDFDGTSENSKLNYTIVAVIPGIYKRTDFEIEPIAADEEYGLFRRAGVDLDRDILESNDQIRVIVEVVDNGKPALTAQKEILIKLVDINDNPPRILNKKKFEHEIVLFEDQTLGNVVTKIMADDLDEGSNGQLKYEIISERTQTQGNITKEKSKHFSVNKNGEILLVEELDYEQERQIELIVRISDVSAQPLGLKQTILFSIHNVNDNPPVFVSFPTVADNDHCQLEIEEGRSSKVFYQFIASDADDFNGPFNFEIIELSTIDNDSSDFKRKFIEDNVFKLGLKSGELTLAPNHELDRESVDNYKILIRLKDQEILGKQLETLKECHIQIKDVNDNSPQFMPEQLRINNTVLRVFPLVNEVSVINWFGASDSDLGNNATIKYELVYNDELSRTVSQIFTIDERGYLLMNGNGLENSYVFNIDDKYNVSVIARDMGTPRPLVSRINFLIEIDESYFKLSKSIDRLELDTVSGQNFMQLEENSDANAELTQVVVRNSFLKNNTGMTQSQIQLKFKLLTCNETFGIDETGVITVKDNNLIDFETIKQFLVTIEATETYILNQQEKRRKGTMTLIVKVNNINDNSPVFNKESYSISLNENIFETPFVIEEYSGLIKIIDNDLKLQSGEDLPEDQNDLLNVQLIGRDSHKFTLERIANISTAYSSFYRVISLSSFDAELKDIYDLEIRAFDGKYTTLVPLTIRINDINDNSPRFQEIISNLNIDENLAIDTPVITVKAFDADRTTDMNRTNFKITRVSSNKLGFNLNNIFTIDKETGQIKVADNQLVDREIFEYFNVTVKAFNTQDERMSDEISLIFRLNDLNDNKPLFDEQVYELNLREKSLFPRAIMELRAVDLDLNSNAHVTYFIKKMNGNDYKHRDSFYIEGNMLMLNKFLDLDAEPTLKSFKLVIKAEDKGGLSDETIVIINVVDINDHKPKVNMNQSLYEITENNAKNQSLFTLQCVDPDFSRAEIKYELEQDLNGDWAFFTIDQATGEVRAAAVFDYEEKRVFNLRFKCTDLNGIMISQPTTVVNRMKVLDSSSSFPLELSSAYDMRIAIIDLDDNEPEFGRFVISRNVSDSLKVGETIDLDPTVAFIPNANDRDFLEANKNISYFIVSGNEEGKFSLNRFTGELKLVEEFERSLRDIYRLEIRATSRQDLNMSDLANPTSTLQVIINVVAGDLFIEFAESDYYVNTPKAIDMKVNFQKVRAYQFNELRNIADPSSSLPTSSEDYRGRLEAASIFFSRAHLIQRKSKRSVRFSVELVQFARKGSNNFQRLPLNTVNTTSVTENQNGTIVANKLMQNALDLKLDSERVNLFDIDSYTGKVYINRQYLTDMEYGHGDVFVLTVVATAYELNSNTVLSEMENTVTRLFVRITELDYSLVLPVTNTLETILQDNLNPLKEKYVPRMLEADNLRITIQDLVLADGKSVNESDNALYNVIIQVETGRNHQPYNLDGFADVWKNFSISPVYFDTMNRVSERQFNKRGQPDEGLAFLVEPNSDTFNSNMMFWFLILAVLLVSIVIMFYVNCYCLKRTIKKQTKKSGLLIEYPPGFTPIYKDGVLNLNTEANTENDSKFEDQELVMNIVDNMNQTLDESKLSY